MLRLGGGGNIVCCDDAGGVGDANGVSNTNDIYK
jgi:hypothetical protein